VLTRPLKGLTLEFSQPPTVASLLQAETLFEPMSMQAKPAVLLDVAWRVNVLRR
jgi:hypothetical protein